MKAAQYLSLSVIGIAMLGAGSALADELPLPTDPAQQREKMRGMSPEDRTAYREQMQERMRKLTPEEQKLMRETRADGRTRKENQQSGQGGGTRPRSRDGSAAGGGYGQGYESRRGDAGNSGGVGGRGMSGVRGR